eukprot:TRINITY_DN2334_c0_g5_i1.p1 TRINITY_DN2334_c0_g5~~TRINITY_DN2334_c0_g5_i1.p1  ORF type:complete len:288 (-),score=58.64 TRINITY_DN2334_c0_g5_i1:83-946(-)
MHYLPKKGLLLTGSWDKTLKLHQVDPTPQGDESYFKTVATYVGHSKRVNECKLTSDGLFFVSTSMDQTSKLWQASPKADLMTFRGIGANVFTCDISHDDQYLVTGSSDHAVRVWDIQSGEELGCLKGHEDWVTSVRFSPYSRRLVSGSRDGKIIVWDSESGDQLEELLGHTKCVMMLSYSPNGKLLASASEDCTLKIWDAHNLQLIHDLRGHTHELTTCLFFRDRNDFVVTGSSDQTIRIWNVTKGEEVWIYDCEGGVLSLEVTENDDVLVGDSAGQIYILRLNHVL